MKSSLSALLLFFLFSTASSAAELSQFRDLDNDPNPGRARLGAALEKGLEAYESVRDYKAMFQKQERSGNILGPKESIFLKFEKPFKIFMGWTNTTKKGLQVLYERGKHQGKLAVHKPGLLLGLAPLIFLDQNSPWVREGSESYNIEDAGIGSFLNDFSQAVLKAAKDNRLEVTVPEGPNVGETMDVTFARSKENDGFFAYRVVVHFNEETALPDRMELFDWQNQPMGVYAYENLQLNVGNDDPEFKQFAMRKIYQLYLPAIQSATSSNNFNGKNPRATPTDG